jgi:hypothetical protein
MTMSDANAKAMKSAKPMSLGYTKPSKRTPLAMMVEVAMFTIVVFTVIGVIAGIAIAAHTEHHSDGSGYLATTVTTHPTGGLGAVIIIASLVQAVFGTLFVFACDAIGQMRDAKVKK